VKAAELGDDTGGSERSRYERGDVGHSHRCHRVVNRAHGTREDFITSCLSVAWVRPPPASIDRSTASGLENS
jgi:hypothetical protein